jgi:hypothetical protein
MRQDICASKNGDTSFDGNSHCRGASGRRVRSSVFRKQPVAVDSVCSRSSSWVFLVSTGCSSRTRQQHPPNRIAKRARTHARTHAHTPPGRRSSAHRVCEKGLERLRHGQNQRRPRSMLPEMKCLEIRVEPVISYQSARIAFGHLLHLIALC